MRALCLLLALAGCGTDVEPHSGSRLKLSWFVFDDGTRQWNRNVPFHDAARNEDCTAVKWADGNTYCTPPAVQIVFADPGCTQRLARNAGTYAVDWTWQCNNWMNTQLYPVGPPVAQTDHWLQAADGSCNLERNGTLFSLGDPIPTSDLVQLTTRVAAGSRLHVQLQESADGMSIPLAMFDDAIGAACVAGEPASAQPCVPLLTSASGFADPACTLPTVIAPPGCADPYVGPYDYGLGGCPQVYQLGPATQTATHYVSNQGTCQPQPFTPTAASVLYPATGEVQLLQLTREHDAGPSRLQPVYQTVNGFRARDWNRLFDSTLGATCVSDTLADGTARCLPEVSSFIYNEQLYSDSQCSIPLSVAHDFVLFPGCQAVQLDPSVYAFRGPGDLVTVGDPYTGTAFRQMNGSCAAQPTAGTRTLGAAVPVSTFAAATLVVDP
jgi:hypothetical protein